MIFPKFIKKNDVIGICALSAGVGHKIDDYEISLDILKSEGYKIKEEGQVRVDSPRPSSAKERSKALKALFKDDEVDMIMCAAGGDFLYEVLPYVDIKSIKENPKWFMGASDPTSICFMITTKLDIASLYGFNGGSFEEGYLDVQNNLSILKGKLVKQKSYDYYEDKEGFLSDFRKFDHEVYWDSYGKKIKTSGRCIGGCLDVLKDMIGTSYEDVKGFVNRYKDDGIIWYFDIFAMTSENVYRTLLQMKSAGWFKHTKAVLFGRVLFDSSDTGMTYKEAYEMALGEYDLVMDMDIGHTSPRMTLINGAIINVESKDGKGSINFELK